MNEKITTSQFLPLSSIVNIRELGGYKMTDGRTIKHGVLLRGGCLYSASDEDMHTLTIKYKIKQVFDFRTDMETKMKPDRLIAGAQFVWLPTIDPKTEKMGEATLPPSAYSHLLEYLVENCYREDVQQIARNLYPELVRNEYTQLQYAAFLQMMASPINGGVYWHCSQGKDRTGLGAAFLLLALGADMDLVLRDFELSNEAYLDELQEARSKVIAAGYGEEELKVIQTFIGVNTEYFTNALNIIDTEFGSIHDYMYNQLCLTDDDIVALRNRFLE